MTGALLLMTAATATAAGPGETFLVGGLPLPAGAIAGGDAGRAEAERTAVSADRRYVAFVALADGLSPEAGVDLANVYRKDRQTGEVVFVSRADGVVGAAATRSSREVSISADGNRVGFVTEAGSTRATATASRTSTCATSRPAERCWRPPRRREPSTTTTSPATAPSSPSAAPRDSTATPTPSTTSSAARSPPASRDWSPRPTTA